MTLFSKSSGQSCRVLHILDCFFRIRFWFNMYGYTYVLLFGSFFRHIRKHVMLGFHSISAAGFDTNPQYRSIFPYGMDKLSVEWCFETMWIFWYQRIFTRWLYLQPMIQPESVIILGLENNTFLLLTLILQLLHSNRKKSPLTNSRCLCVYLPIHQSIYLYRIQVKLTHCICLNGTIWWVFTYVYTHEITTTE